MIIKKLAVPEIRKVVMATFATALLTYGSGVMAQANFAPFFINTAMGGGTNLNGLMNMGSLVVENPQVLTSLVSLGKDTGAVFFPVIEPMDQAAYDHDPAVVVDYFVNGGSIMRHRSMGGEYLPGIPVVNEGINSGIAEPSQGPDYTLPGL